MVLDFGLITNPESVQTADYKSAGSNQTENASYLTVSGAAAWNTLYTVPTGKTYYCSCIVMSTNNGVEDLLSMATGGAGSEAAFLKTRCSLTARFLATFPTPIKFSSGTRISVRAETGSDAFFTIVGWTE
jgi:hypothetical protein